MLRPVNRAIAGCVLAALGLGLSLGGCVDHQPEPAFRASVLIDDRGISIPLPPPSLVAEPEQDVDVMGEVIGAADTSGLTVRIADSAGGSELVVPLGEGTNTFHAEGLAIDLLDNCIEVSLVDADGRESERVEYRAVIDDSGDAIEVVDGCN